MSNADKPAYPAELKRFLSKVNVVGDCWEFNCLGSHGYGVFWLHGKNWNAHRASFYLHNGSIPDGGWVLHKCDNPKCVNPNHLYVGDAFQNARDMVERGRSTKGERHGSKNRRSYAFEGNPYAKLTKQDCVDISMAIANGVKPRELAEKYSIHFVTVHKAKHKGNALIEELQKEKK